MQKILIVEDDRILNTGISLALRREGYQVFNAECIKEALKGLSSSPDLVLLDINLPDGDGREFLRQLRLKHSLPVILLTARDQEQDMLRGFDSGCDDYITKPFSMPLLLKRIQAVVKRTGANNENCYYCNNIVYDFQQKLLTRAGEQICLTATEYRLLEYFLKNAGQVLTRRQILERVWDSCENYVDEKTLNVNISRLREKLEEDSKNPVHILTMFGIGYKWSDDGK